MLVKNKKKYYLNVILEMKNKKCKASLKKQDFLNHSSIIKTLLEKGYQYSGASIKMNPVGI